jgi:hypothetical protein
MKAGDIIYTKLTTTSAVTTLISTRVYPLEVPLAASLPAVYYDVQLAEAVDGSAPMQQAQVTVGCLAHTEAGAHGLANVVHAALNGMTRYSAGTWLRSLDPLGRTDDYDTDSNVWRVLLVYGASVTF